MKTPIQAAQRVIQGYGITPDRCDVLQDAHTLVVRLTDTIVARIVTDATGPRKGTTWFDRETAIAAHLSRHQAPIIPLHPELPPIAHLQDGFAMNFWEYVTAINTQIDPGEMAQTLHHCHDVLKTFTDELPHLAILHESLEILEECDVAASFDDAVISLLRKHLERSIDQLTLLPHQVLHGDAHMGNILMTTKGLLWTDWEDAFRGPVEWDLASLIWNAKLLDQDDFTVKTILSSYQSCGNIIDDSALDLCLVARAAVMTAWYPILYPNPSTDRVRKLQQRISWLRSMV